MASIESLLHTAFLRLVGAQNDKMWYNSSAILVRITDVQSGVVIWFSQDFIVLAPISIANWFFLVDTRIRLRITKIYRMRYYNKRILRNCSCITFDIETSSLKKNITDGPTHVRTSTKTKKCNYFMCNAQEKQIANIQR